MDSSYPLSEKSKQPQWRATGDERADATHRVSGRKPFCAASAERNLLELGNTKLAQPLHRRQTRAGETGLRRRGSEVICHREARLARLLAMN